MKKILSTFMLFIMLIVATAPTIAMHFCGQNFHSVNILSKQALKTCCSKTEAATESDYDEIHKGCCETKEVQIATDSFQLQGSASFIATVFSVISVDWLPFASKTMLVDTDKTMLLREHFPPEGFDAKDMNILGFICISRI